MAENKKKKESLSFQAEVSKLLDIVANSLYSEREIFLRELISNSADACEKLRYLAITKKGLLGDQKDLSIHIRLSKKKKIIEIEDNGIGMSRQELIDNLGTIARSGTNKFIEAMKTKKKDDLSAIGQFGVGFYSSYMVAETVDVLSKSAENKETNLWSSNGKDGYSIENQNKKDRGTIISLKIKKDADEFLDSIRLRSIITKYSNYIPFPIYLKDLDSKDKEEKVNEGEPLWLKDKKKIKKEDYKQFYNNISFNFDDPLKTIHYNAEGVINYKALLFLPTNQPMDLFNPDRKNKIKLYVQKVFITDDCEEIIPHWLRFIPGVVDSQDISLNISREMLQNNPIISKIKKGITIKILNELSALADVETKAYLNFWKNFGAVIKEGLYEFNDHHDKILPLLRFHTSENEEVISLDDYLLKMVKNQNEIYYFANTDKEHIKNSPQLETFIDKKIPVLFMTDAVDEFWLQNASKYKDKTFKSITKGKIDLSKIKSTNTKEKENSESKNNTNINDLINVLKKELENKISNVVVSNRLTKSPIILIADESGMDINMEKLMKMHNKTMPDSKKILEINPNHPMILKLSESLSKIDHKKLSSLLLDQANILDGNVLSNPTNYIESLTELFIK
ncbi:MAG: molecular chaperone HtpG [Pelagibacteraceae bacterium]|jgi:molecular chaperone HtpG|nr:molecular chaperone HtpG [Pelagibacteraceae bacterium]MBO6467632.1 molecular chaperone HtpG [Pelagibacteraceae bacterium]MBO6470447.1 molecular chaperone HtpG [Pelagibacteraceae bacterium]MBO6470837.1 molecular chaperone HtpG [Pelagibacteraceae bacterium]HJO13862.1 molecular chaperone HtpG [Alphaproteobacteria bacterium]